MRIHVYEYVSGGGMADHAISPSLLREALLMRDALLADLGEIEGVEVSTSLDPRCPRPGGVREVAFERALAQADAIWPVAPESGGALAKTAAAVLDAGRRLLGSRPQAIAIAGSKSRTAARLAQHGIAVAPIVDPTRAPADGRRWVVKPDDGAGSSDTWQCRDVDEARARLRALGAGFVAQPWIDGDALSLSVVGSVHGVELLSVNRQRLSIADGEVRLDAIDVNVEPPSAALQDLAARIADAIPGLDGYFGVDFVRSAGQATVIEVNPRLTTSYAGLREVLAINVAARVLEVTR